MFTLGFKSACSAIWTIQLSIKTSSPRDPRISTYLSFNLTSYGWRKSSLSCKKKNKNGIFNNRFIREKSTTWRNNKQGVFPVSRLISWNLRSVFLYGNIRERLDCCSMSLDFGQVSCNARELQPPSQIKASLNYSHPLT